MREYRSPKIVPLSQDKRIKKSHPFLLFLGIWFSFLLLAVVLFLGKFRQYLISYEAEYQASLPEHAAESVVEIFQSNDMVQLGNMMNEFPQISEFETEEDLYNYMAKLVEGRKVSYAKTRDYTDDAPDYYITADNYIIGRLKLKQSGTEMRKYGLPYWEKDVFEFYTEAEHSVRVSCPTNYHVYLNGKEIPIKYCYKNDPYLGEVYFNGTIQLPNNRSYYIDKLYGEPEITAKAADGTPVKPEFDTTSGMYKVSLTVPEEVETEMIDFVTKAALTYTHYVANDASQAAAAPYFLAGTNYLQMVEYGTSRKYYPGHRIQSEETEVVEFLPFDNDHFFCQLNINQVLLMYGSQEHDITTECRFYCMRTNQGFKVCGLEY